MTSTRTLERCCHPKCTRLAVIRIYPLRGDDPYRDTYSCPDPAHFEYLGSLDRDSCTTGVGGWESAARVSERWAGVSARRVVSVAEHIGIGHGRHSFMTGSGTMFSAAAVGLVERELLSRGHEREVSP